MENAAEIDEEEEDEEENEGEELPDDFLDREIDSRLEITRAKNLACQVKKNRLEWSGQDVLIDKDP